MHSGLRLVLVAAVLSSVVQSVAEAQPSAQERAQNVVINGVIGATRAAWSAYRGRRPVPQAIAIGFVGGASVAGGKQLTAFGSGYWPLAGRLVGATGNAMSVSAGLGELALAIPLGPLLLTAAKEVPASEMSTVRDSKRRPDSTTSGWRWHARLNVLELGYLAHFASKSDYRFDAAATFRGGAPVFRKRAGLVQDGSALLLALQQLGTVLLAEQSEFGTKVVDSPAGPMLQETASESDIVGHEGVHVLQEDQFNLLAALPLERALVHQIPGLRRIGRHVDLGILGPLIVLGLAQQIPYERRPWEREAALLADKR